MKGPLSIHHIRSRTFHRWNILADTVEDAARQKIPSTCISDRLVEMSSYHAGREWEWAQPPFIPDDIGMPNIVDGALPFVASPQLASLDDCPKQGGAKEAKHEVGLKVTQ
eukprot:8415854-Pyramimonas_sp.AAC.1